MIKKILSKILKNDNQTEVDSTYKALKRFLKEAIKPNLILVLVAVFFMIVFSLCNASFVWITKPIINNVFIGKEADKIIYAGLGVILIALVKSLSQYTYTTLLYRVSVKVMAKIRKELYKVFVHQDLYFHHKNSPGKLVSVTMNELNAINVLSSDVPINIGRDLFTFLAILGYMFSQNYIYALLIVFSILLIVLPVKIIGKKVKSSFAESNKGFGELTAQLEQTLNGIKEVKSYNKEKKEEQKVDEIIKDLSKTMIRINRLSSVPSPMVEFLSGIVIGLLLIYSGYQYVNNQGDPGLFFSFIASFVFAYQPLKRLTDFTVKLQLGSLAVKRYYSFIDSTPNIKDVDNAKILEVKKAEIEFKNVSFSYNSLKGNIEVIKEKELVTPAIHNMSFSISSGENIALVGRSGGGKSTIMSLIGRFYDPDNGEILIDGQNIKNASMQSLRESISIVSQEVVLFDDTIYNNIAYSKENVTREEVIEAAERSHALDFINSLPKGFDTVIGPRGAKLSGGQRQRLSIARALLKDSPILLLDEATSALDNESERKIQSVIDFVMSKKTTIIIAHRLSTVINCDRIFVIEKGHIVEQGKHDDLLLNDNSFYKYYYDLQFQKDK